MTCSSSIIQQPNFEMNSPEEKMSLDFTDRGLFFPPELFILLLYWHFSVPFRYIASDSIFSVQQSCIGSERKFSRAVFAQTNKISISEPRKVFGRMRPIDPAQLCYAKIRFELFEPAVAGIQKKLNNESADVPIQCKDELLFPLCRL